MGEITSINNMEAREDTAAEEEIPRDWYPFDPYVLPRSKGFVADYFLDYTPVHQEDEDMTDGSDAEMSSEMDSEEDEDV